MRYITFLSLLISFAARAQYKEFTPDYYYKGDTVKVTTKNSLFVAAKSFNASAIPSENAYWDYAGFIPVDPNAPTVEKLDLRLKNAEASIVILNNRLKAVEDSLKVKPAPTPTPAPTPVTGYLALPLSGPLDLSGKTNIVIEGKRFRNTEGACIKLHSGANNITIRNCFFDGSTDEAIDIENASNITIENCLFARVVTGVYAVGSKGIKVRNNQFVNVRMRSIGGRGQFVQLNKCSGEGNLVENNQGENFPGESDPEDLVSIHASSGTAQSPIIIRGNMFRGGGPSTSGGGIIAGDYGGGYVLMENNTLLNPGQYGMSIAGGHDIKIINNKIYSKQFPWSNNPLYVWAQQGAACSNNYVSGNYVYWIDKTGSANNGWDAGNCPGTVYDPNKSITEAELNVPTHLITFVTPVELLTIRK